MNINHYETCGRCHQALCACPCEHEVPRIGCIKCIAKEMSDEHDREAKSALAGSGDSVDELAREVGKALCAATLAPGEALKDPGHHAIVHTVLGLVKEKHEANAKLSASESARKTAEEIIAAAALRTALMREELERLRTESAHALKVHDEQRAENERLSRERDLNDDRIKRYIDENNKAFLTCQKMQAERDTANGKLGEREEEVLGLGRELDRARAERDNLRAENERLRTSENRALNQVEREGAILDVLRGEAAIVRNFFRDAIGGGRCSGEWSCKCNDCMSPLHGWDAPWVVATQAFIAERDAAIAREREAQAAAAVMRTALKSLPPQHPRMANCEQPTCDWCRDQEIINQSLATDAGNRLLAEIDGLRKRVAELEPWRQKADAEFARNKELVAELAALREEVAAAERQARERDAAEYIRGVNDAVVRITDWARRISEMPPRGWKDTRHEGEAAGQAMLLANVAAAVRELVRDALAPLERSAAAERKPGGK